MAALMLVAFYWGILLPFQRPLPSQKLVACGHLKGIEWVPCIFLMESVFFRASIPHGVLTRLPVWWPVTAV
jgi:hypothetical protein